MAKNEQHITGGLDAKLPSLKARGYLRKDIAPLIGVKGRTIQHYTDMGLVVPEVAADSGKGQKRRYSERNILEFLLIQKLLKVGIPLAKMRPIIERTSTQWLKMPQAMTLILSIQKQGAGTDTYEVELSKEKYFNFQIDLEKFVGIIFLDLSDIAKEMSRV